MKQQDWLEEIRREKVVQPVLNDKRTVGTEKPLGFQKSVIFNEIIGGGQANFDVAFKHLSPADRVRLYCYFNQKGHLEELVTAFEMLFSSGSIENPIVVDLGCGPFTAGLALSAVFGHDRKFTYVGLDHSRAMKSFGEELAVATDMKRAKTSIERKWVSELSEVNGLGPLGWRPIIVVASYLLASPTIVVEDLVNDLESFIQKHSRGPVTLLYTNSSRPTANISFPLFSASLQKRGFAVVADENGKIIIRRGFEKKERDLKFALFQRQKQNVLNLKED